MNSISPLKIQSQISLILHSLLKLYFIMGMPIGGMMIQFNPKNSTIDHQTTHRIRNTHLNNPYIKSPIFMKAMIVSWKAFMHHLNVGSMNFMNFQKFFMNLADVVFLSIFRSSEYILHY